MRNNETISKTGKENPMFIDGQGDLELLKKMVKTAKEEGKSDDILVLDFKERGDSKR